MPCMSCRWISKTQISLEAFSLLINNIFHKPICNSLPEKTWHGCHVSPQACSCPKLVSGNVLQITSFHLHARLQPKLSSELCALVLKSFPLPFSILISVSYVENVVKPMWTDFALTSAIPAFILLWNAARSGEWFFAVALPAATDSTGQAPVPWFMLNLICGCQNYWILSKDRKKRWENLTSPGLWSTECWNWSSWNEKESGWGSTQVGIKKREDKLWG